jgi:hypothetical protein
VDAGLVAELGAAAAEAPDRDAPTPQEPTEFALSATAQERAQRRRRADSFAAIVSRFSSNVASPHR